MRVVQDVDIDLQLAAADQPGSSHRPDLVLVDQAAVDRVAEDGEVTGSFTATEPYRPTIALDELA